MSARLDEAMSAIQNTWLASRRDLSAKDAVGTEADFGWLCFVPCRSFAGSNVSDERAESIPKEEKGMTRPA